eukprot:scaffold128006_cov69-Phaeocystis_antarctica.AAC.1
MRLRRLADVGSRLPSASEPDSSVFDRFGLRDPWEPVAPDCDGDGERVLQPELCSASSRATASSQTMSKKSSTESSGAGASEEVAI